MPFLSDRIRDTTTDTGTITITVTGTAPSSYYALSSLATGTVVDYVIAHQAANEVEEGRGTIGASNTLQRDQGVTKSSNSNALVSFSAGTKDVFVTVVSNSLNSRGRAAAMPYALR